MAAHDMKKIIKHVLAARDDMYAKLDEKAKNLTAENLEAVDGETILLLKELSDDRFSFRDMARTLLERVCDVRDNATCKRMLANIVEEDVHN